MFLLNKKKPSGAENRKRRSEKDAEVKKNTQNISRFLNKGIQYID